jgi:hypothetical protein
MSGKTVGTLRSLAMPNLDCSLLSQGFLGGAPMAALRAGLRACATLQDIQEVMAALLVQAKKGNVAAARLYLAYTVGKPTDTVHPEPDEADQCPPVKQNTIQPQAAPPAASVGTAKTPGEIPVSDAVARSAPGRTPVAGAPTASGGAQRTPSPAVSASPPQKSNAPSTAAKPSGTSAAPAGSGTAARGAVQSINRNLLRKSVASWLRH